MRATRPASTTTRSIAKSSKRSNEKAPSGAFFYGVTIIRAMGSLHELTTSALEQAARVADFTGFMYLGALVEHGSTSQMFQTPRNQLTEKYLTGSFG